MPTTVSAAASTWGMIKMSASPRLEPIVREALQLRKLARALLVGAAHAALEKAWLECIDCSAAGWDIFLRTERCAIWFCHELTARGLLNSADAKVRETLQQGRQRELRRVLTARAQLQEIAAIASESAAPLIVLKGGAAILQGRLDLDLSDLDLLPAVDDIAQFAARLDSLGYTPNELVECAVDHLMPRSRACCLEVEIHKGLRAFEDDALLAARNGARRCDLMPGLARFSPSDHLWHLLMHLVLQHTERTAAIRDLLLIRNAAADCSNAEIEQVSHRIRASHVAAALQAVFDEALRRTEAGAGADPFFALSATRYACAATIFVVDGTPSVLAWRPLKDLTLAIAFDHTSFGSFFRSVLKPAPAISRRLQGIGRWPALSYLGLVALRIGRFTILMPAALCLAYRSARVARTLQRGLTPPESGTSLNRVVLATGSRRVVSPQPFHAIGAIHD
jgi:hypothetical protein